MPPGHDPGHVAFDWDDLVAHLIETHGTLARVAEILAAEQGFEIAVESAERGLRRLRKRGAQDGKDWGQRVLRCFGLPSAIGDRVRWMGQYHTRFVDLPASLGAELVRAWDRPPVSEARERIWLLLARANLVLRRREDARPLLQQAALAAPNAEPAAQAELALVECFALLRDDRAAADAALARAGALLEAADHGMSAQDHACLFARWIDQVAYPLNKGLDGPPDHAAALDLYRRIPADGPLFARCRRANGLGWTLLRLGDRAAAERHARDGVEAAGDSGSLRLRAMALNLLARTVSGDEAARARARALAIAQHLEDEALAVRFEWPATRRASGRPGGRSR